ncbi:MAG: hypothetical protein APR63_01845 [Desulfuromonas sp. SDB]|nr:MAG: hypothetical protein APR63_01845 [Desulfuromonas sp. SDB]
MESVKEVHLYIEGGGDQGHIYNIFKHRHPEFLWRSNLKVHIHGVEKWPEEPFVYAAVELMADYGIKLTDTNHLTEIDFIDDKRIYLVMIK